jgi:ketosteroid isomerase-like protein
MRIAADEGGPAEMLHRLWKATNDHDLDGIAGCFAPAYSNETPAHPERGFTGSGQVRRNWEQILAFVPDLTTDVVRYAVAGDTVWSEWEHRGTRRDGSEHHLRGVVVFGVADGRAAWARLYLEPVERAAGSVDVAVHRQVARSAPSGVAGREGPG